MSKTSKDTEQLWSPALRRARKGWKDNRDLIEKFAEVVKSNPKKYPKSNKRVISFWEIVEKSQRIGYNKSEHTAPLAEWIRQEQRKQKASGEGASATELKILKLPMDLDKTLKSIRKSIGLEDRKVYPVSAVFRKEELLGFAKKRALLLHGTEDLSSYLESLVRKEQSALEAPAGSLFDLIECCEQIARRKGFHVSKSFEVNALDLWIPELRLAIEPRTRFESVEEGDLFRLLTLSSHHYDADYLAVVLPNELAEDNFQSCRSLQHIVENLKVLRMGDFEEYLEEITLATNDAMEDMGS